MVKQLTARCLKYFFKRPREVKEAVDVIWRRQRIGIGFTATSAASHFRGLVSIIPHQNE
jgi:hypothetical protein